MSYLARLKAKIGEKHLLLEPTKPTEGAFVGFVGGQGKGFSRNDAAPTTSSNSEEVLYRLEESAAMIYSGPYAEAFAALEAANPTNDPYRWQQAKTDARAFLERWAEEASLLGWSDLEMFGLHPTHPLVRHDAMGLVWLLRGRSVVGIEAHRATLSNGGNFYRGHWPAIVN